MFRRLSLAVVVASLVFTIGAHWAILQMVAWTGMLVTYAQQSSLSSAIKNTFDGQHPCKLCKVVADGKASEKKQELGKTVTKIDFFPAPGVAELFSRLAFEAPSSVRLFWNHPLDPPLIPPPRLAWSACSAQENS